MPLFECTKCHCVENTALSNYWSRDLDKMPALCSACDPEIGKWHGEFPKERAKLPKDPIHFIDAQAAGRKA